MRAARVPHLCQCTEIADGPMERGLLHFPGDIRVSQINETDLAHGALPLRCVVIYDPPSQKLHRGRVLEYIEPRVFKANPRVLNKERRNVTCLYI